MAKDKIKGITVAIGGDTTGLQKALTDVSKKSGQLNSELRQVENALKLDPTNTVLLAQKQEILAEQVKNTSTKLNELKNVQAKVEERYKNGDIGAEAYRAFQRELTNTENSLSSLREEQNNVSKSIDNAKSNAVDFTKVLEGTQSSAKLAVSAISSTFEGISTAVLKVTEGLADIGQKAFSAGKEIVNMVDSVASAGDVIDKSSQAAGMSAEVYQEWGYVLQRNGASADGLAGWMKKLNNNVDDAVSGSDKAVEKFTRLGISVDDLQNKSREEVFSEVITALQGMENESERAAAVNDLLGGSATDLGALLNSTAEDTQALKDNAQALGLVMSDEAVADSAAYEDALLDLQSSVTGVKNSISAYLLPSFTEVMQGVTGLITGTDEAGDTLKNGMSNVVKSISENVIPKVTTVVSGLSKSLLSIAPDLIGTISELINSVTTAIAQNSPMLASIASDLIQSIADGLVSNSWTIMNAAENILRFVLKELPNVINTLFGSAGDYVSKVINFLVDISAIVMNALPDIITELINKISDTVSIRLPQIISSITRLMSVVAKNLPQIIKSVIDELPVLLNGIIEMVETILTQLTPILSTTLPTLISIITDFLPEIINNIVNVIFENLPILLEGVSMLVMGIVNALPSMIENIIGMIPVILTGIAAALSNSFPSVVQAVGGLILKLAGALPDLIASLLHVIPELINSIIVSLAGFLPVFIDTGIQLFTSLIAAVPVIINAIADSLPQIIDSVIDGLLSSLPQLLDCVIEIVFAIADNLPDIAYEIIKAFPLIFEHLAEALIALTPRIFTVVGDIIWAVADYLPKGAEKLVECSDKVGKSIINKFKSFVSDFVNIGKNLVEGIWEGILGAGDWISDKVTGWCETLEGSFADFFGIHSPSTLFHDKIGSNLAFGIGEGFEDTMPDVSKDMQEAMPTAFDIDPGLNLVSGDSRMQTLNNTPVSSLTAQPVQSGGVINFTLQIDNFNNTANTSVNDLSETITTTLYELIRRNKLAVI